MPGPLASLFVELGIDARQVATGIDAAERAVGAFSQLRPEVTLGVDDGSVIADVASAGRTVNGFDQLDASAVLAVDDAGVQAEVGSAAQAVNGFDQLNASAVLTVDDAGVQTEVGSASQAVDMFDQQSASATLSLDDEELRAGIKAADAELRRITGQKKQLIRLGIDSGPLIDELDAAEAKVRASAREMGGALDSLGPATTKAGGFFSRFGEIGKGAIMGVGLAVGSMATNFLLALPTAAIGKFGDAIQLASGKAEAASKVNALFGDSAHIVMEASETAAEKVQLSSGAYLTAAGNLGNLTTNLGFAGDEAAKMSVDMITLAADMGSFNDASPEEVLEAMGAAFRGETEPIRRFGVMLSEAAVQEKAVQMGLVGTTKEFNNLDFATKSNIKAQATYALILDQTSKAQGDLERTSDSLSNKQKENAAKLEEAWTRVGEALAPIAADVIPVLADAFIGLVDTIRSFIDLAKKVVDAVQPIIKPFTDWIGANKGLVDAIKPLVGAVGGLGLAIAGLKLTGLLGPTKELVGMFSSLGGKIAGFIKDWLPKILPQAIATGTAAGVAEGEAQVAGATGPSIIRTFLSKFGLMTGAKVTAATAAGTAAGLAEGNAAASAASSSGVLSKAKAAGSLLGKAGFIAGFAVIAAEITTTLGDAFDQAIGGTASPGGQAAQIAGQTAAHFLAQGFSQTASTEIGKAAAAAYTEALGRGEAPQAAAKAAEEAARLSAASFGKTLVTEIDPAVAPAMAQYAQTLREGGDAAGVAASHAAADALTSGQGAAQLEGYMSTLKDKWVAGGSQVGEAAGRELGDVTAKTAIEVWNDRNPAAQMGFDFYDDWQDQQKEFGQLGEDTAGAIAQGMTSAQASSAMEQHVNDLKNIIETEWSADDKAKFALGKEYLEAVQAGMKSESEDTRKAAAAVAIEGINAIEDAAGGTPDSKGLKQIGMLYDQLLAGGLTASEARVALAAGGVADEVIDKLETGAVQAGKVPIGKNVVTSIVNTPLNGVDSWVSTITRKINGIDTDVKFTFSFEKGFLEWAKQAGHLALGGPAKAGDPYLVGEKGPELWVPERSGYIIPNNQLREQAHTALSGMQSGNVTVNVGGITINAPTGAPKDIKRAVMDGIAEVIRDGMANKALRWSPS